MFARKKICISEEGFEMYICIDLKSFYASAECAERGLDPFTVNLVVADPSRGFRVIIVIEANSYVNIKSSRLLPKFKTQKINSWCAA